MASAAIFFSSNFNNFGSVNAIFMQIDLLSPFMNLVSYVTSKSIVYSRWHPTPSCFSSNINYFYAILRNFTNFMQLHLILPVHRKDNLISYITSKIICWRWHPLPCCFPSDFNMFYEFYHITSYKLQQKLFQLVNISKFYMIPSDGKYWQLLKLMVAFLHWRTCFYCNLCEVMPSSAFIIVIIMNYCRFACLMSTLKI